MKKQLVLSFANALIALSLGLGVAARAQDAKPGDAGAGEKKIAMCEGCHNLPRYQASFPEIYKVPMIAGQNAKYIAAALAAYRKGERKHPTMRAIAGSLSDQDIADVAAYYAQLGSPPARPPPRRRPPRPRRRTSRRRRSPSCSRRPTALPATAAISARRSTRRTRSSRASTPTTSTSR
jgi:cytochrome c553